jgi:hypothetical protein
VGWLSLGISIEPFEMMLRQRHLTVTAATS